MRSVKANLVKVVGSLDALDDFISSCCLSGYFYTEQASQYISSSSGFTSLSGENPFSALLAMLEEISATLNIKFKPDLEIDFSEKVDDSDSEYIKSVYDKIKNFNSNCVLLEDDIKKCKDGIEQFLHFKDLDVDLNEILTSEFIKIRFGRMPKESYNKLFAYDGNPYVMFTPCSRDKEYCWGLYVAPTTKIDAVDRIFTALFFERFTVPSAVGSPIVIVNELKKNIDLLNKDIKVINDKEQTFWEENAKHCTKIYSKLIGYSKISDLKRFASFRGNTFFCVGYVPLFNIENFKKTLAKLNDVNFELYEKAERKIKISKV